MADEKAKAAPEAADKPDRTVLVYVLPRGADWPTYSRDGVVFNDPGPTEIKQSQVTDGMRNDRFLRLVTKEGKPLEGKEQVVISATDTGDGRSTLPLNPGEAGPPPQTRDKTPEDDKRVAAKEGTASKSESKE